MYRQIHNHSAWEVPWWCLCAACMVPGRCLGGQSASQAASQPGQPASRPSSQPAGVPVRTDLNILSQNEAFKEEELEEIRGLLLRIDLHVLRQNEALEKRRRRYEESHYVLIWTF